MELNLRPAFLRQAQVYSCVREVGVVAIHVFSQTCLVGFNEFVEVIIIGAGDPTRGVDARPLKYRIHSVLRFEAMFDHFKLQLPDRTDQWSVVHQR